MAPVRRRPEPFFYAAFARGVTTLLQSVFLAFRKTFPARQSGLRGRFEIGCQVCSSSSSALASFKSSVSKPSVNQS
jgi:hypothetical protein